ncbi:hypothetical protein AVEN_95821-1 [Araneus ventricosus]|uniref:DDE-1 domain-containing protein n=1 Tax=Araneus ventricosus TaxID=182803 RepID=A0A4Y2LYL0_ARAVE|nr:hypothetical protein AVEN_95821-1 [Araneus ventricosus]
MISAIDRKEQLQVSVLNAIFYIDQSWNIVSQKTIANCFRHTGFHSSPQSEELLEDDDEDLPLTELAEKLRNRGYPFQTKICMQRLMKISLLTVKLH